MFYNTFSTLQSLLYDTFIASSALWCICCIISSVLWLVYDTFCTHFPGCLTYWYIISSAFWYLVHHFFPQLYDDTFGSVPQLCKTFSASFPLLVSTLGTIPLLYDTFGTSPLLLVNLSMILSLSLNRDLFYFFGLMTCQYAHDTGVSLHLAVCLSACWAQIALQIFNHK